ncbi:MAG TPA: hypothetical protein VM221_00670 [Armatimonadota bacterium]|nr:hypothetical protein [Armatimonadota bacterium]
MTDDAGAAGFFRGVYVTAALALGALVAGSWWAWGGRAAAGMAAGGAISIGVLVSWQWVVAWMPGGSAKRRLLLAWPLKYGVVGAALWALLRYDLVNVIALIAGLGLVQAVIFGRALAAARTLADPPRTPPAREGRD